MAFDNEPVNNQLGLADQLGFLSVYNSGGSTNLFLGQPSRTVQSATGSMLQGFTVTSSVKDEVDYLTVSIGNDVQSVRLKPGLLTAPSIDAARIIGGLTHVEFRPVSGLTGAPVIIEARIGYSKVKTEAEQISVSATALVRRMEPYVLQQDPGAIADMKRLQQMGQVWDRMAEGFGQNISPSQAIAIATEIRGIIGQGGYSFFSGEVNAVGENWARLVLSWHTPQYTLDRGTGPRVVSQNELSSFLWNVQAGAQTGLIAVSGYTATLSGVNNNGSVGTYKAIPLNLATTQLQIDTAADARVMFGNSKEQENIEGDYDSKNIIFGGEGEDRIYGGQLDDILDGGEGDDWLWIGSGSGEDIARGGVGLDTVVVEGARNQYFIDYDPLTDRIVLTAKSDEDVPGLVDYFYGVERISFYDQTVVVQRGTAAADKAPQLVGGSGDDILHGLAGNDLLDGQAGQDLLVGGLGDDKYYVDNAGDKVVEGVGEGKDTIYSWIGYTLADNIENLTLLVFRV